MKKILLVITSLLFLSACSDPSGEVESRALKFLNAYMSRDLSSVSDLCSPELSDMIGRHAAGFEDMDSSMVARMDSVLKTYSFSISECMVQEDTAVVNYRIISGRDTVPSDKTIRMVKGENGWTIVALQ